MQREYYFNGGKIVAAPEPMPSAPIWVVVNPDEAEKRRLIDEMKIDEHTLSSALDPDELSRVELEPDHLAVIFKRPKNYSAEDNFLFKVVSTGLFLFKDRLIVVLSENVPLLDGKPVLKASSPADAMLRILFRTITHFLEHLRVITLVTDSLEQKINASMENRYLFNLFTLEKSLVYYLNALNSNSMAIDRLRNHAAKIGLTQEQVEYLEDLDIESHQCTRQAEIYSNILSSMGAARASIVNNNLSAMMKTLSIVTVGLMVPTLVVSAFSMNVAIPMQKHPNAFWIIMSLAIGSVGAFLALWRYKKW